VLGDQREQLAGQGDPAAAGRRLDIHLDEAAAVAIGAPAGVAGAVRRAGRRAFPLVPLAVPRAWPGLVVPGAARMRIGAAVLPGLPLQALHDLQGLAGLVQPGPFEPERFALPQSERESDDEPDPGALAQRQGQDALDLLGLERVDFVFFDAWRLGQGDGVAGDVAALECLAEGGARGAVYLVRGDGLEPAGQPGQVRGQAR